MTTIEYLRSIILSDTTTDTTTNSVFQKQHLLSHLESKENANDKEVPGSQVKRDISSSPFKFGSQ